MPLLLFIVFWFIVVACLSTYLGREESTSDVEEDPRESHA